MVHELVNYRYLLMMLNIMYFSSRVGCVHYLQYFYCGGGAVGLSGRCQVVSDPVYGGVGVKMFLYSTYVGSNIYQLLHRKY